MENLLIAVSDDLFKKITNIVEARRAEHFKRPRILTPEQQQYAQRLLRLKGQEEYNKFIGATLRPSDHLVSRSAIARELLIIGLTSLNSKENPPPKRMCKVKHKTSAEV